MKFFSKIICLSAAAFSLTTAVGMAAAAGKSVALVEQGSAAAGDVQELDLLQAGDTFDLAAGETIVIGYMTSCTRETINGGAVTIGEDESKVTGGKIAREAVQCAEPRLDISAAQSQESALIAFRPGGETRKHIFTRTPLLMRRDAQVLMVEISEVESGQVIGKLQTDAASIDLAAEKIDLAPGKTYMIKRANHNTVILEIDATAKPGGAPLERVVLVE